MAGKPQTQGDLQRTKVLAYLKHFHKRHGYMPSLKEVSQATEVPRSTLAWHLDMLRDEGKVDFDDGLMARSLRWPR